MLSLYGCKNANLTNEIKNPPNDGMEMLVWRGVNIMIERVSRICSRHVAAKLHARYIAADKSLVI